MIMRSSPWHISAQEFPADGSAADQLEFLLGYAILAPSPHNTQPWRFRINSKDVEIFVDSQRALPVADPEGRELVMSCGAVLFNLRVAAEHFGHQYRIFIEPDPHNADLLARFQLDLHGEAESEHMLLFDAIARRRTCRHAFEEVPLPAELLEAWTQMAEQHNAWLHVITEESARLAMAELVAEGDRQQWANKAFREELSHWARTKPEASVDGFAMAQLGVNPLLALAGTSALRTFNLGDSQAKNDREIALHSPVLAVIGTAQDSVTDWLNAGQAMENIFLSACSEGMQASYLNQPIEQPELRGRLAQTIGRGGCPQALLRLGIGPEVPATPRRQVKQLLIAHQTVRE